jgi:hypothetical protein
MSSTKWRWKITWWTCAKVAIVEEQNQDLREQNSRLTLALDDALAIARRYRGGNQVEEEL